MKQIIYIVVLLSLVLPCKGKSVFETTKHEADSLYNIMKFREAYNIYYGLLGSDEVKEDVEKKLVVLNDLSDVCDLLNKKSDQMLYLQQLLDLSSQQGNDYYHSQALMMMGKQVYYEGDKSKGIGYIEKAIDFMKKTDDPGTDHLIHSQLNVLITLYMAVKDFSSALQASQQNVNITRQGTRWGRAPQLQQQDQRVALSKLALSALRAGRRALADSAYAEWKEVPYEGYDPKGYFIVDYLRERGLYREASLIYDGLISEIRAHGDTVGTMMQFAKWGLAEVCQRAGDYHRAADLYAEVLEIADTLKERQARSNAQELAALYETHEKEQELQQRKLMIIVLGAVSFVSLIVIVGLLLYFRKIRQKNHLMHQVIDDMLNNSEASRVADEPKEEGEIKDPEHALFLKLDNMITKEKLFTDPNLNRDKLCELINVDKNRIGKLLKQYSDEVNLTAYINRKRMFFAVGLMREHPNWTILAIAQSSGITNTATFNRLFRNTFGMSPTEYLKA